MCVCVVLVCCDSGANALLGGVCESVGGGASIKRHSGAGSARTRHIEKLSTMISSNICFDYIENMCW